MRSISQSGFHRIPKNPKQRAFGEGGSKQRGGVLDAFNERSEDKVLHPTKGYRKMNVKRGRAQVLANEILQGFGRPLHLQRRFLREGY